MVGSLAVSDHFPVELSLVINMRKSLQPSLRRPLKNVDVATMGSLACGIQLDPAGDVDSMLHLWQSKMIEVLDTVALYKSYPMRTNKPAGINGEIKQLINQRNLLARKVMTLPNNPDLYKE